MLFSRVPDCQWRPWCVMGCRILRRPPRLTRGTGLCTAAIRFQAARGRDLQSSSGLPHKKTSVVPPEAQACGQNRTSQPGNGKFEWQAC